MIVFNSLFIFMYLIITFVEKKNERIVYKLVDIVCFIGGSVIFIKILFSYYPSDAVGKYIDYSGIERRYKTTGITYSEEQTYLLALGFGLVILGFLIRSWRKN